jgi:hypothetical protein
MGKCSSRIQCNSSEASLLLLMAVFETVKTFKHCTHSKGVVVLYVRMQRYIFYIRYFYITAAAMMLRDRCSMRGEDPMDLPHRPTR